MAVILGALSIRLSKNIWKMFLIFSSNLFRSPEAVVRRSSVKKVFCKKKTLAKVFSCEFCEIFINVFFYRTPLVAASKSHFLSFYPDLLIMFCGWNWLISMKLQGCHIFNDKQVDNTTTTSTGTVTNTTTLTAATTCYCYWYY